MTANPQATIEAYGREADALADNWEKVSFAELHRPVLHLLPAAPCDVLDVGAGSGRDAAVLAAMGHRVVAVEPAGKLRASAIVQHASPRIEWLDDRLPELASLRARRVTFDLVMLTAVWMHLDEAQRRQAMPGLASMTRPGGTMIMSLRHGPAPADRCMFDIGAEETIELARAARLDPVLHINTASVQPANRRAGVTWTRLAFAKSGDT
jgi:protein-L-isoaspartate O-methyltransferase